MAETYDEAEAQAVAVVLTFGHRYGFGNLIDHLKEEWISQLRASDPKHDEYAAWAGANPELAVSKKQNAFLQAQNAELRRALESIPYSEYGDALREGCDLDGAWDVFRAECEEHIGRALAEADGSKLLEVARVLDESREKRRSFGGGTKVTNCVVHMGLPIDERPNDCDLCRTDLNNFIRRVILVNEFLNGEFEIIDDALIAWREEE